MIGISTADLCRAYDLAHPGSQVTKAMRSALHDVVDTGHVDWSFFPASHKRLAGLGLVEKDDGGWCVTTELGRLVDELIQIGERYRS